MSTTEQESGPIADGPVGEVPPEVDGWREGMPNAHAYCASTISALRVGLAEAREGFDRWREIGNMQAARADAAEARLRAVEALMERSKIHGVYPAASIAWADLRAALSSDAAPQAMGVTREAVRSAWAVHCGGPWIRPDEVLAFVTALGIPVADAPAAPEGER